MSRANHRLGHLSLSAAILLAAVAAPSVAEPAPAPPPPRPAGPLPVPYPDPPPPETPECPPSLCPRVAAGGTAGTMAAQNRRVCMLVPLLCPKPSPVPPIPMATLEVVESSQSQPRKIDVLGWSWGSIAEAGTVETSDPQEGGQVAGRRRARSLDRLGDNSATVETSDPQEGGQVAARTSNETSDPMEGGQRMGRKAGKGQQEWRTQAEPLSSGMLAIRVPRGSAVKGQHLAEVKLSARGRDFQLREVEVAACETVDEYADACLLTYQGRGSR